MDVNKLSQRHKVKAYGLLSMDYQGRWIQLLNANNKLKLIEDTAEQIDTIKIDRGSFGDIQ